MSATIQLVERCKTLRLQITKEVTYLPYLSEVNDKFVKFIDVCDEVTEDEQGASYAAACANMFCSLIEKDTNIIKYDNFSLENFCLSRNKQNRLLLNFKIDLEKSYLFCRDSSQIGKYVYILIWYTETADVNKVTEGENNLYCANSFEVVLKEQKTFFQDNRELYDKKFLNFLLYAPKGQIVPPIPPIEVGEGVTANASVNANTNLSFVTYNNNNSIVEEDATKLFVSFVKDSTKIFDAVPLYVFLYTDVFNFLTFNKVKFDFTLSYITIALSSVNDFKSQKKAIMFNCIYQD